MSVTATADTWTPREPFVLPSRNGAVCLGCERALEPGEAQWRVPVVHVTRYHVPPSKLGGDYTTRRYYEREDAFCADCAPPHVEAFEEQRWVQFNYEVADRNNEERRFPVESSCPVCTRPLLLYGSHYGLACNCGDEARPEVGELKEFCGLRWLEMTCVRCKRPWHPASEKHPLRIAGSEGVPCSERCRKALYRRASRTTPAERACEVCEEMFTPKRADARYCSNACRQDAYRKRRLGVVA
jgi:hypothetical protein